MSTFRFSYFFSTFISPSSERNETEDIGLVCVSVCLTFSQLYSLDCQKSYQDLYISISFAPLFLRVYSYCVCVFVCMLYN